MHTFQKVKIKKTVKIKASLNLHNLIIFFIMLKTERNKGLFREVFFNIYIF